MKVRQCSCGAAPKLTGGRYAGLPFVRLACACGRRGARIICHDRARVASATQAAVDGWNVGH
jgi:hypothetical protein